MKREELKEYAKYLIDNDKIESAKNVLDDVIAQDITPVITYNTPTPLTTNDMTKAQEIDSLFDLVTANAMKNITYTPHNAHDNKATVKNRKGVTIRRFYDGVELTFNNKRAVSNFLKRSHDYCRQRIEEGTPLYERKENGGRGSRWDFVEYRA